MKYRIIKKYDFKIHTMISLFISVLITLIRYIYSTKAAYSIGIIGGTDGPTADNISYFLMKSILVINEFSFIPVFVIVVLLYKPVKCIIEKMKEE